MESFQIICVTCGAKLSVRNRSAIGQILACPRCNSMVEITGPNASADEAGEAGEAMPENIAEGTPQANSIEANPEATASPMAWEATSGAVGRKWIAWSVAGLLVGAILVTALLIYGGDDPQADTSEVSRELPENPKPESPKPAIPAPQPKPAEPPAQPTEPPPEILPKTAIESPLQSSEEAKTQIEPAAPPIVHAKPPESVENKPSQQVDKTFDPLEFDPERLDLAQLQSRSSSSTPKPSVTKPMEPKVAPQHEPAPTNPMEADEVEPAASRSQSVGIVAKPMPEENSPTVASRLALRLPKLSVRRMPLVDFMNLVSQMADVPISVEPKQLRLARISTQAEVSVEVTDLSIENLLRDALKPLRLQHAVLDKQVVLRCMLPETTAVKDFPVDDLVTSQTTIEDLASWVRQLIAPQHWQTAGGEGTLEVLPKALRIQQPKSVQLQVLIFLEQLRLARGIPPASRYPVERLSGQAGYALLADKLAVPTTFTFLQATPLDEVFRYWQRDLNLVLLVDWPALAEVQMRPQTQIFCAVSKQPWQNALDQVLEPIGLEWRAVSEEAIEITSAAKARQQPQLQLYCLQPGSKKPEKSAGLLKQIRKLSSAAASDDPSAPATAVVYDPTGQVLAVLAPAAGHRRIQHWLSQQDRLRVP